MKDAISTLSMTFRTISEEAIPTANFHPNLHQIVNIVIMCSLAFDL